MNSRANIAFNLLPVIALILCGLALFSFLNLDDNFGNKSSEFAELSGQLGIMEQYIESSAKMILLDAVENGLSHASVQESVVKHDLHLAGQGNFFSKIEEGEFTISKTGNFVILKVEGIFIQSRQGNHLAQRNFDITIEVNERGEFIKFINK